MPLLECENKHLFNGNKYGNRCPYCGLTVDKPEEPKTAEQKEEELRIQKEQRVCGWLVCIEGPDEGKDFRIRKGRNYIGSGASMDIRISGDKQIAVKNHAAVVYNEKTLETVLLPGESNGLVYWENTVIYEPKVLDPFSRIELGSTALLFVPFCGQMFDWNKQKND